MTVVHKSVLLEQVIYFLGVCREGVFIDCTLGEGGHTKAILKRIGPRGALGLDADAEILKKAREGLSANTNVILANANFTDLRVVMAQNGISNADAILIDLGISMFHYKESGRGFSFDKDEKLDMRVDTRNTLSAFDVVNSYSEEQLKKLFWAYGEERFSPLIASRIVRQRQLNKIVTARELAELISSAVPKKFHERIHPATRVFQAIRIEVNSELANLESVLGDAAAALNPGGRLAVISFHSLEDRIVKHKFLELADAPVIDELRGTRAKQKFKVLTKKPVEAEEEEIRSNAASRSAKLRVIEKVSE